jgi:hypothetical protein
MVHTKRFHVSDLNLQAACFKITTMYRSRHQSIFKRLYIFFLNGRNGDFGEKSLPTTYLNDHLNIEIFHSAASSFGWCLMAGAGLF